MATETWDRASWWWLQQLFYGGTPSIALRQKQPQEMFCKKRPEACNFIKKETQLFSCEFCKISKNTFFTEHLWTTASVFSLTMGCLLTLPRPPVIVVVNLMVSLFFFSHFSNKLAGLEFPRDFSWLIWKYKPKLTY